MKIRFRSYGTNAGGPANAGGAPSSSRKMQATKAQVDEVRIGYIDVGDGCWIPNVLVTRFGCW